MTQVKIVFGMLENEYHAVNALSNSGIKELLVNPLDFWFQSWLNPSREEKETTPTMMFGKAFHALVLEGGAAFQDRYCAEPSPEDYPEALRTATDMKNWLKDNGHKQAGNKADLIQHINENDGPKIWDDVVSYRIAGREAFKPDAFKSLTERAEAVRSVESVQPLINEGCAEVSIFWTEEHNDEAVNMKARLDKLKPNGTIIDLKTFNNTTRRKFESAVAWEVLTRKYHLQAALYNRAGAQVIEAARDGTLEAIGAPDGFIAALATAEKPRFAGVFVQNHGAPNVLAREFAEFERHGDNGMSQNGYYMAGDQAWRHGVKLFAHYMKTKGTTPWREDKPVRAFRDDDFPVFMQDGLI